MRVDVVVLNYNGGSLFLECLPSLSKSVEQSRHECRLVILDNQSSDGSDQEAARLFNNVTAVKSPKNLYLCSYNDYLKQSDCDVAILLNNDIKVDPGFIDPLVSHFESDKNIFMVTPKCLSFDGSEYEGGITRFRMKYGIFWASAKFPGYENEIDHVAPTMAAGYGAFDRNKFLELGGYDDLYLPGRLEDTDLCFRAWKKGWRLLYEPSSVVYHKGGVSFHRKFGESGTMRINHRNSFLFVWKNIHDPSYLISHFVLLPFRLLAGLLMGKTEFVMGFFDALPLFRKAVKKRVQHETSLLSDRSIFNQV